MVVQLVIGCISFVFGTLMLYALIQQYTTYRSVVKYPFKELHTITSDGTYAFEADIGVAEQSNTIQPPLTQIDSANSSLDSESIGILGWAIEYRTASDSGSNWKSSYVGIEIPQLIVENAKQSDVKIDIESPAQERNANDGALTFTDTTIGVGNILFGYDDKSMIGEFSVGDEFSDNSIESDTVCINPDGATLKHMSTHKQWRYVEYPLYDDQTITIIGSVQSEPNRVENNHDYIVTENDTGPTVIFNGTYTELESVFKNNMIKASILTGLSYGVAFVTFIQYTSFAPF